MESSVNIYFYIIIYIILLFFILSNNKEKTAIVTLTAISILLYSNLKIQKICKIIIGIMMITQLLQLYNFNKIKEAMDDSPHPRNSPFAARLPITTYYVDDNENECKETTSNDCDLQSNIDLYNYINNLSYPSHNVSNNNLIIDLDRINNEYYLKIRNIDIKLKEFFNNVNTDNSLCEDNDSDYNLTKDSYNDSCNKLKIIRDVINRVNNLIGQPVRTPSYFKINCSEGFVGRNETSDSIYDVIREIQYFTNSYNKSVSKIKEGVDYDYTNTKFTPQSGWFRVPIDNIFYNTYNSTAIELEKVKGGGLLCEIFDINENEYNTIKNNIAPPIYEDVCTSDKIPTSKTVWNNIEKCQYELFEGFREGNKKLKKKIRRSKKKAKRLIKKAKRQTITKANQTIRKATKKIAKILKTKIKVRPPRWLCKKVRVPKTVTIWKNQTNCINEQTASYSINDNTPFKLVKKISDIRNNGNKIYLTGRDIKNRCKNSNRYQTLWTYDGKKWRSSNVNFEKYKNDIFINPMAIINNIEVMNYKYKNNEFNSITRGPTMLATTCSLDSFMNYFLFITGKITFKFNTDVVSRQKWFKLQFKTDDYGCIIIHPTNKDHDEFNTENDFNNSIVLQSSKWSSKKRPANSLHSKYRTLKNEKGQHIFNANLENNTLKLSVANNNAVDLIKKGADFHITIMYMHDYGGGKLRFNWMSSENTLRTNMNLHDGPYIPKDLSNKLYPSEINPGILFSPNTSYARRRNQAFLNWYLTNASSTIKNTCKNAWIFAPKNTPFNKNSNINLFQYIAAKYTNPRDNSVPEAFTGKREGIPSVRVNDIINRPCPCLRLGVIKNNGNCSIYDNNYKLAIIFNDKINQLHTRVNQFYTYAYQAYFGRVIKFRKHVLRVMLKNLLCKVFLEDGILLNEPDHIDNDTGYGATNNIWGDQGNIMNHNTNFFTSNQQADSIINNSNVRGIDSITSTSDAIAQRIRNILDKYGLSNSYTDEIHKIIYLYNLTAEFSMENEMGATVEHMVVPSLRDKDWLRADEDRHVPVSHNDLRFYNSDNNEFDENEYKDWQESIEFKLPRSREKYGSSINFNSFSIEFNPMQDFKWKSDNPNATITFANQTYIISLETNKYPNNTLQYIENVIEQALALDSSIYKDPFTGRKEGFDSPWVNTPAGTKCVNDFRDFRSGLMSEYCIKYELEYIFNNNDSLGDIYNILKRWFCDRGYSPNNPLNFFKELDDANIECNHRTKSCDNSCVDERYSIISYSHNTNLSSNPSTKITECISFVTDFLDLYDKISCFLEKFNYAYDNNIINGPNGLIALFPLDRADEFPPPPGKDYDTLVSCKHTTFEKIERLVNDINKNYYNNPEFILYSAIEPHGVPFNDKLPRRNDIVHRVMRIKKSENDLVNYIYKNKLDSFQYVPSVISNCYSKDNITTINNNDDKNIITCNHNTDNDIVINDAQLPQRSMYIKQQSDMNWNLIPNDFL